MSDINVTYSYSVCPESLRAFKSSFRHNYGPVGTILSVVSIVTCILNATILSRRSMRSATNTILTGIALADLCTATIVLPLLQTPWTQSDPDCPRYGTMSLFIQVYKVVATRVALTSHTCSVWFGVLLAGFRFATVSMSSGSRSGSSNLACDIRRARLAMLLTFLSITGLLIPYFAAYVIHTPGDNVHAHYWVFNGTVVMKPQYKLSNCSFPVRADFFNEALDQYLSLGLSIQCKVLPCVLMTGFSILLVRMLHIARMKRISVQSCALNNKGGSGSKRSSRLNDRLLAYNRTTTMLLCIITLINVIELPNAILLLLKTYNSLASCIYRNLGELIDFCALLKNAAIFTLYCSMSSDFRRTFRQWISCRRNQGDCDRRETSWTKYDNPARTHRLSRLAVNNNNNNNTDNHNVLEDKSNCQYTQV